MNSFTEMADNLNIVRPLFCNVYASSQEGFRGGNSTVFPKKYNVTSITGLWDQVATVNHLLSKQLPDY